MLKHLPVLLLALFPLEALHTSAHAEDYACHVEPPFEFLRTEKTSYVVTATIYHADPRQCNADFTTTADGSKIDTTNPSRHRWIAVSRDMLSKYGGHLKFGDSLMVTGTSTHLDGIHIVRDLMNKRYRNRIDFLVSKNDIYGKWHDIRILKVNRGS